MNILSDSNIYLDCSVAPSLARGVTLVSADTWRRHTSSVRLSVSGSVLPQIMVIRRGVEGVGSGAQVKTIVDKTI